MRKIIVSNLASLDGFVEGANRELDWHTVDEEFFAYARDLLASVDTLLFGRVTYQMMESFWTTASDEDPFITEKMNSLPKLVFSRTLKSAPWGKWNNARLITGDVGAEMTKIKQQPGRDMVIFGSAGLISSLAPLGLIDDYRVFVNPVILGRGNLLFKGIPERIKLKLLKTREFKSGMVMLSYRPDAKT